jgi:hypothetical protein
MVPMYLQRLILLYCKKRKGCEVIQTPPLRVAKMVDADIFAMSNTCALGVSCRQFFLPVIIVSITFRDGRRYTSEAQRSCGYYTKT